MEKSNYIEWMFSLNDLFREYGIELSDYDEFYIKDVIAITERILKLNKLKSIEFLDENLIDEYVQNAITMNPSKQEYYETIGYYVKKRFIRAKK